MWNLSSPTRDQICTPALEVEVSTTRQPEKSLYVFFSLSKNLINETYLTYSLSYKLSQRVKFKLQALLLLLFVKYCEELSR